MAGEQRLELAQELHDVLAHHISLINVQAGVALHLIDEQPERARPALAEIKDASREALRELRGALDILRRGVEARRGRRRPRLAELDRLVATVARQRPRRHARRRRPARRRCRRPSSSPPTASSRRR